MKISESKRSPLHSDLWATISMNTQHQIDCTGYNIRGLGCYGFCSIMRQRVLSLYETLGSSVLCQQNHTIISTIRSFKIWHNKWMVVIRRQITVYLSTSVCSDILALFVLYEYRHWNGIHACHPCRYDKFAGSVASNFSIFFIIFWRKVWEFMWIV